MKLIDRLAALARAETAPAVEVRDRVLGRLILPPSSQVAVFSIFSAASAVAASVVLALGIYMYLSGGNAMDELVISWQGTGIW